MKKYTRIMKKVLILFFITIVLTNLLIFIKHRMNKNLPQSYLKDIIELESGYRVNVYCSKKNINTLVLVQKSELEFQFDVSYNKIGEFFLYFNNKKTNVLPNSVYLLVFEKNETKIIFLDHIMADYRYDKKDFNTELLQILETKCPCSIK